MATSVADNDLLRDPAVLDRILAGEPFVITRGGVAVAEINPVGTRAAAVKAALDAAFAAREKLRAEGVRVTTDEIIAWKNEGRR